MYLKNVIHFSDGLTGMDTDPNPQTPKVLEKVDLTFETSETPKTSKNSNFISRFVVLNSLQRVIFQ